MMDYERRKITQNFVAGGGQEKGGGCRLGGEGVQRMPGGCLKTSGGANSSKYTHTHTHPKAVAPRQPPLYHPYQ